MGVHQGQGSDKRHTESEQLPRKALVPRLGDLNVCFLLHTTLLLGLSFPRPLPLPESLNYPLALHHPGVSLRQPCLHDFAPRWVRDESGTCSLNSFPSQLPRGLSSQRRKWTCLRTGKFISQEAGLSTSPGRGTWCHFPGLFLGLFVSYLG